MSSALTLKTICIIGKFDDEKYRQILINSETENAVLNYIVQIEGSITVLEKELEGIEITRELKNRNQ